MIATRTLPSSGRRLPFVVAIASFPKGNWSSSASTMTSFIVRSRSAAYVLIAWRRAVGMRSTTSPLAPGRLKRDPEPLGEDAHDEVVHVRAPSCHFGRDAPLQARRHPEDRLRRAISHRRIAL